MEPFFVPTNTLFKNVGRVHMLPVKDPLVLLLKDPGEAIEV